MIRLNLKSSQAGLSLIELLVSMLIASIVLAGVVSVVHSSRVAFNNEQETAFIQENVRYATEMISRDIRMAGSWGCGSFSIAKVANIVDGDLDGLFSSSAIIGFEGSAAIVASEWADAIESDAEVGSDAVILRYADPATSVYIADHSNYNAATLKLHEDHTFTEGDKLMVVDNTCRNVGIFELTSGNNNQVKHDNGNGSPGNCTKVLFATNSSFDCDSTPCNPTTCAGNPAAPYGDGANVMAFVANAYYIGESSLVPGTMALKRQVLTSAGHRSEELAQGVEKMELLFGVDSDSPTDGEVDRFVSADLVADWETVFAVRYSIVFRSQNEIYDTAQSKTLLGVVYNDKYMRQIASATVRIRNRKGES